MDRRLESVPKGKLNFINRPANKTFCFFTRIKNQGFLVSKKLSLFLANNLQTVKKKIYLRVAVQCVFCCYFRSLVL